MIAQQERFALLGLEPKPRAAPPPPKAEEQLELQCGEQHRSADCFSDGANTWLIHKRREWTRSNLFRGADFCCGKRNRPEFCALHLEAGTLIRSKNLSSQGVHNIALTLGKHLSRWNDINVLPKCNHPAAV